MTFKFLALCATASYGSAIKLSERAASPGNVPRRRRSARMQRRDEIRCFGESEPGGGGGFAAVCQCRGLSEPCRPESDRQRRRVGHRRGHRRGVRAPGIGGRVRRRARCRRRGARRAAGRRLDRAGLRPLRHHRLRRLHGPDRRADRAPRRLRRARQQRRQRRPPQARGRHARLLGRADRGQPAAPVLRRAGGDPGDARRRAKARSSTSDRSAGISGWPTSRSIRSPRRRSRG